MAVPLLLLTVALTVGDTARACRGPLGRLTGLLPVRHSAPSQDFTVPTYRRYHARWSAHPELPRPGASPEAIRRFVDTRIRRGEVPTNGLELLAFLDVIRGGKTTESYLQQLKDTTASGVEIVFRPYRFPYGWASRSRIPAGQGRLRSVTFHSGWRRLRINGRFPYVHRPRRLVVRYPAAAPRTAQELVQLAYEYSSALSLYRIDQATRVAPRLSLPVGRGKWSYPEQALTLFRQAEAHLYGTLKLLSEAYPEVPLPLPERDRLWRARWLQLGWEFSTRIAFPSYRPFRVYRPNQEHYEAYREGLNQLRDLQRRRYEPRLRLDWTVDRWRDLWLGLITLSIVDTLSDLVNFVESGAMEEFHRQWEEAEDKFAPEALNRALEDYQNDEQGFQPILDHYNRQIEALLKQKEAEGDPDGAIERRIRELERRRDFLAY